MLGSFLKKWLRLSDRPTTGFRPSLETMESRLAPASFVNVNGAVTVTLNGALDHVFFRVDAGGLDIGSAPNGEDLANDLGGVTSITVVDAGASPNQGAGFLGVRAFPQAVTLTGVETVTLA